MGKGSIMPAELIVSVRALGRRKPLLDDWSVPLPPEFAQRGEPLLLRDLIARIVAAEVAAFRQRQEERQLVRVLSAAQIAEGARRGKVDMGGRDLDQAVDEAEALATALTAFEDGLYLVLVDGTEQRELDREVFLHAGSRVTFLRLTMLAGG